MEFEQTATFRNLQLSTLSETKSYKREPGAYVHSIIVLFQKKLVLYRN